METNSGSQQSKLHELIGKAITDQDFASRILDRGSQAEALKEMGVDPTPEVLEELNLAIGHLEHLWTSFSAPKAAS